MRRCMAETGAAGPAVDGEVDRVAVEVERRARPGAPGVELEARRDERRVLAEHARADLQVGDQPPLKSPARPWPGPALAAPRNSVQAPEYWPGVLGRTGLQ